MEQTIIMPVGVIEESTATAATFRLTPQGRSLALEPGAPVTVWRYHPERLAMAKFAGRIIQVDQESATFTVLRAEVDERWPLETTPLGPGAPVYLAQSGSFEPDITRMHATVWREDDMPNPA